MNSNIVTKVLRHGATLVAMMMMAHPALAAAPDEIGFQSYLQTLRAEAANQGVDPATLSSVFPSLSLSERVIELDRGQPGGSAKSSIPAFAPYRAMHVDDARISRGRRAYAAQRSRVGAIERKSGVPAAIMIAIWGHETNYGSYTGNFDLLQSLATLAYEGRRRTLFAQEFIDALKIIDRGISRETLKGSWAGATGNPQFLPSIYLRLAQDGDGDGKADIWNSEADTLASIANYFVNAGWRAGEPWGVAVTLPSNFQEPKVANQLHSPRCPRVFERHSAWHTMAEWRALGIVPQSAIWPADSIQATLLQPDGPDKTAYLLTGNYRVILDYNCSNFYALSVGLLADSIGQ